MEIIIKKEERSTIIDSKQCGKNIVVICNQYMA